MSMTEDFANRVLFELRAIGEDCARIASEMRDLREELRLFNAESEKRRNIIGERPVC